MREIVIMAVMAEVGSVHLARDKFRLPVFVRNKKTRIHKQMHGLSTIFYASVGPGRWADGTILEKTIERAIELS